MELKKFFFLTHIYIKYLYRVTSIYFVPIFFLFILLHFPVAGYLMCIFEEKLDDTTLEQLQGFEFAVS